MNNELETVGLGLTWEKLPPGRKFRTVGRTITEADLVNFISATGMVEVLFTTVGHKSDGEIKGRLVPAALAYTFAEGLLIQSTLQSVGLAFLDMELKVKGPAFVGDTIHVEVEVIECRQSKSPSCHQSKSPRCRQSKSPCCRQSKSPSCRQSPCRRPSKSPSPSCCASRRPSKSQSPCRRPRCRQSQSQS